MRHHNPVGGPLSHHPRDLQPQPRAHIPLPVDKRTARQNCWEYWSGCWGWPLGNTRPVLCRHGNAFRRTPFLQPPLPGCLSSRSMAVNDPDLWAPSISPFRRLPCSLVLLGGTKHCAFHLKQPPAPGPPSPRFDCLPCATDSFRVWPAAPSQRSVRAAVFSVSPLAQASVESLPC